MVSSQDGTSAARTWSATSNGAGVPSVRCYHESITRGEVAHPADNIKEAAPTADIENMVTGRDHAHVSDGILADVLQRNDDHIDVVLGRQPLSKPRLLARHHRVPHPGCVAARGQNSSKSKGAVGRDSTTSETRSATITSSTHWRGFP